MAKATLVLPSGTKVTIEGTKEEVAHLLEYYSGGGGAAPAAEGKKSAKRAGAKTAKRKAPKGPTRLIRTLIDENYFKQRRALPDVQKKLEEGGHIYAQTSLSPVLLKLVKNKELRRLKDKKRWVYVN